MSTLVDRIEGARGAIEARTRALPQADELARACAASPDASRK